MKVRLPLSALVAGERTLDEAARHYAFRVLRLIDGDVFVAFDPERAREATGKVLDAAHGRVELAEPVAAEVVAGREILWIQGGAKGEKMDAVVRDATELGATRFCGARTERSLLKLDGAKAEERRARWERIAREAARQSGRGDGVTVHPWMGWAEALALATTATTPSLEGVARFCAWEGATAPLGPPLTAALLTNCPLAFAAGPEGGLTEEEAAIAEKAGWALVSLGPFLLRTETVAAAVLGAVRILGAS
jgi:16S rRNA (uracil1498-N3)-methyltransferase